MSMNRVKNNFQVNIYTQGPEEPKLEPRSAKSTGVSWPVAVFITIIFFPVGMFLLFKRIDLDKKNGVYPSIPLIILGGILMGGSLAALSEAISMGALKKMLGVIIFYGAIAFLLIFNGIKSKKEFRRFKKYRALIIDHQMTSIDDIATAMGSNYGSTKRDIKKMINKGYLDGVYIDEASKRVVLPKQYYNINMKSDINNIKQNSDAQVITCKGCGATNKVSDGFVGECEFCGSPLAVD